MRRVTRQHLPLCVAGAIAFGTQLATGQTAPDATSSAQSGDALQEVLVTAQKRSESIQSVPLSVTAVDASSLQRAGVGATSELGMVAPGFTVKAAPAVFSPTIRGIGTSDGVITNEPSVATYVDGVYYGAPTSALFSFNNIERIEVLRGPQGTLFGRNALGGLVNVITETPTQQLSGRLFVGYGNYDTKVVKAYLTSGITSSLAADVAAYWSDQGNGWGRDIFTGSEVYQTDERAVRSKWLFTPGDLTSITFTAGYSRYQSDLGSTFREAVSPLVGGPVSCNGTAVAALGTHWFDICNNWPGVSVNTQWDGSLHIDQDLGFAKGVSITAYQYVTSRQSIDQDGTQIPFVNVSVRALAKQITQELQLQAPDQSKLKWIVGLFYMGRDAGYLPQQVSGLAISRNPRLPPGTTATQVRSLQSTASLAGFAQATYPILQDTNLTAGVRYTTDRQTFTGATSALPEDVQLGPAVNATAHYPKTTYRLAVDHSFGEFLGSDALLGYASFDRGFKAGTFNAAATNGSRAAPETVDAGEIGFKSDWMNHRVRVNGSAFYYYDQGVQVLFIQSGLASLVNAAAAHTAGGDLELTLLPVRNLTLTAGAEYLPMAHYNNFSPCPNPAGLPAGAVVPGVSTNCDDSREARSPRWHITSSVSYLVELGRGGQLDLNVADQYSTRFAWDADFHYPPGPAISDPHNLLNVQAKWSDRNAALSVAVWAKNLFNRQYSVYGQGATAFGEQLVPGPPRTFGVSLGYQFN